MGLTSITAWIFGGAAALTVILGAIAEKRIEDEEHGRVVRFRQRVETAYQRQIIRHRTPYAEIGWRPAHR